MEYLGYWHAIAALIASISRVGEPGDAADDGADDVGDDAAAGDDGDKGNVNRGSGVDAAASWSKNQKVSMFCIFTTDEKRTDCKSSELSQSSFSASILYVSLSSMQ